ncbi:hypothetical protein DPMN_058866 [Dreissena polymorpha]|uniref:Uncharacterized protein n=1 Tax=Dreissena polymorpha TaxID=45954 RepID=A0A9D4HEA0_DREPO|nr:hypothetical protein DPMN_058866 [Dreissena polymorpha]
MPSMCLVPNIYRKWSQLFPQEISKDTDVSVRDVERWLRDRRVNTRPSDIRKFNECG